MFQPSRGFRSQLAVEVTIDNHKLIGDKKYACIKHYRVNGEKNDYCHVFFKVHQKLPAGAFLSIQGPKPLPLSSQPSASLSSQVEPQASTSANHTLSKYNIGSSSTGAELFCYDSKSKSFVTY